MDVKDIKLFQDIFLSKIEMEISNKRFVKEYIGIQI